MNIIFKILIWFAIKSSHIFPMLVDMARLRLVHFWLHSSKDIGMFLPLAHITAFTKVAQNGVPSPGQGDGNH